MKLEAIKIMIIINNMHFAKFEVIRAVNCEDVVFCDLTPCSIAICTGVKDVAATSMIRAYKYLYRKCNKSLQNSAAFPAVVLPGYVSG